MSSDNTQKLVELIVKRVKDEITPLIAASSAETNMMIGSVLAKLEVIGKDAGAAAPAKRPTRGSERQTGATTTAPAKAAPAADDPFSKIRNAMLLVNYLYLTDAQFRDRCRKMKPDIFTIDEDAEAKMTDGEKEKKYKSERSAFWKALSDDEKKIFKGEYETWKNNRAKENIPAPLEADKAEE